MEIIFTKHARERLKQREISEEMVIDTINFPDYFEIGDENETIAVKHFDKMKIRVIYLSLPEGIKILTVTKN